MNSRKAHSGGLPRHRLHSQSTPKSKLTCVSVSATVVHRLPKYRILVLEGITENVFVHIKL